MPAKHSNNNGYVTSSRAFSLHPLIAANFVVYICLRCSVYKFGGPLVIGFAMRSALKTQFFYCLKLHSRQNCGNFGKPLILYLWTKRIVVFLNSPLPLKEMGILKKYILTLDYANCNIKTFDLHYLTTPVSILIPHHMGGFVSQSIGLVHWAL